MTTKPLHIVAAMYDGLDQLAFTERHWRRLQAVGTLDVSPPITCFDAVALERIKQADVLLTHWGCPLIDATVLDASPQLTLIAHAAGTIRDHVSAAAFDRNIIVTTAAPANARCVAEFTIAAILLAGKDAFNAAARQSASRSEIHLTRPDPLGNNGRTVGIVGASRVGREVLRLAAPLSLEFSVFDPYLSPREAASLGVQLLDLDELCAWSDVLSIHAPLTPDTTGMIGARQLALLRAGSTVINTARGAVIDAPALLAELESRRLSAVLDVTDPEPLPPDHPLRRLPNVFLTPHIAGADGNELSRLADLVVEEIERHATGRPPLSPVPGTVAQRAILA